MSLAVANKPYGLGHSPHEVNRLRVQAQLLGPVTRHYMHEAGIAPGMRVLDIGSGAGDVALLAAELVGESGEVVGIDRSATVLEVARARSVSFRNVSFRQGDPMEMALEPDFDAVIGRYVIQFQPDPAAMLRRLATCLKSGGLLLFHESDWFAARSFPPAPLHDACCRWIVRTMELTGARMHMGMGLHAAFLAAGLPEPTLRLQASIGGGQKARDRLRMLVALVETLAEPMTRLGVADATDIDTQTLFDRLREEVGKHGSVIVGHADVVGWVRLPRGHGLSVDPIA
jgi:SAM-dependent methyltransferase